MFSTKFFSIWIVLFNFWTIFQDLMGDQEIFNITTSSATFLTPADTFFLRKLTPSWYHMTASWHHLILFRHHLINQYQLRSTKINQVLLLKGYIQQLFTAHTFLGIAVRPFPLSLRQGKHLLTILFFSSQVWGEILNKCYQI